MQESVADCGRDRIGIRSGRTAEFFRKSCRQIAGGSELVDDFPRNALFTIDERGVRSDVLGVVFFAAAAGAAFEVVIEVGRWLRTRAPGGLTSGWVLGGFLAGVSIMYLTGLLAG